MAQWFTNPTKNHEVAGSIPGLAPWCCCRLWSKSQTWLGSRVAVAVAVAGSYSSNSTTSLGTSICCGCGPKKTLKKKMTQMGLFTKQTDSQT